MSFTDGCALAIPHRPRTELATIENIEAVEEGWRRLAAWQAYVTKREQKQELKAASRWCEIRIGELLGNGEAAMKAGKRNPSLAGEGSKDDRHKFRLLAKHKNLVAKLIDGGQVSRQQLLAAIKATVSQPAPDDSPANTVGALEELAGEQFGCIYADPPWQYGNQATRAATDTHYNTLSVDKLCEWGIADIAADDAHLHLWTTNAFLPDAFRVIDAWGFEYRSCFVWVKPQIGIGNYWRVSHEFLLLGIRGDAKRFRNRSLRSWVELDRRRHSSKPEEIRGFIESASPGPYLELFGRKPIAGWTVLGNQVEERLFA